MKLVFTTEARFTKDAQGNIYGNDSYNQNLWDRYLEVFKEVNVVARVNLVDNYRGDESLIILKDSVNFIEIPYYIGLKQYFWKRRILKKTIKQLTRKLQESYFICRVPGRIGDLFISELNKIKKPYAVEVVGDPWDVFAPGGISNFFRPILRIVNTLNLKSNVKNSAAALFVTRYTLQKRYPTKKMIFSTSASDVILGASEINIIPKVYKKKNIYEIISVGSLSQMYKSPDIVLKAIKQLNDEGISCFLTWLGGGIYLNTMQKLANELNISHLVSFEGDVSKDDVNKKLLSSDLFILASKTEGLPRVVIEAMAVGLPCIGTRVGGIPELLDEEVLVPRGSVKQLACKMKDVLLNPDLYNRQAERNLKEAANFTESILSKRRNEFYNFIVNNL